MKAADTIFWQSLEQPRTLLRTPVGSILAERVRCLRTGHDSEFISFALSDWVVVVAETPDHHLLIIRQFRHGSHDLQWEMPGGCIDSADTDPVAAGLRELREETGYTGVNARVIGRISPNPALQNNLCYIVKVEQAVQTAPPCLEDTEAIESYLYTPPELFRLVRSGEMAHGIMLDALLFYLLDKPECPIPATTETISHEKRL